MTDDEIVEAFTAKHGITIMPGPFRQQHADLVRMGREAERKLLAAWFRKNGRPQIADEIDAAVKPTA